ncbi:TniB family NTP-binding protein [Comamonas testosteroni]|uniref:TniB family NTP-binding protein n=1 Tax=Comamonas testosteroni TaxID=285 RepID=UPI0015FB4BE1|nr:TniB family NTP-binding protein [Comamonas testosteroni]
MRNDQKKIFDQSMQLDAPDPEQLALDARRLSTYSVGALRVATEADRAFVLFPDAVRALKALDRLFQLGTEFSMPQGMCLIGPSGVGKTDSFKYFRASLPQSALFSQDFAAIGVRVQSRPKTGHLVQGILKALKYPFAGGSGKQLYMRRFLVFDALKNCKTRLIWIDEAHHLLYPRRVSASSDLENEATEFLRELMDECNISLVLAGTSELDTLPDAASHLASRVPIREEMKNFTSDGNWVGFVRAFAKQCQSFDLGYIHAPEVAMLLHLATDGNLRAFKRLMTEAILIAFDRGHSAVDKEAFCSAFKQVCGQATLRSNPFV